MEEGWLLTNFKVYYPDFGNSIDDTARVMIGIHGSTGASEPLQLVTTSVTIPLPIDSYIL